MQTVRQLLGNKSPEVHAIAPDAPVVEAVRLMAQKSIGALLVMAGGRLVGILSERDYARKIVLKDRSSATTPVREIMTAELVTVTPAVSVEECLELVTDRRIRHLPVLDGDTVVGVISIGDLVKDIISEQKFIIEQLENYITGTH